ncbi:hypothetical protein F5B22DRAFT_636398 [Xylaria bambusicola]|uniref:uncharacterized protein n=1 Tax=Xylaria bambusicola TaxID=326684 RepID=UPI002007A28C|nr:uncharacterized protein F5B22DRAFT_636398 [Xylaria bambusicola]KAI0515347.1 hypothetical protein F5B22DRAFT_636398 [Xylaria bambusicola]
MSKPDHLQRTTADPRDKSLHTVILQHIQDVNDTTRIFRLGIPRDSPPIRFLPGQWLDVYIPGVETAGGFTITSTPQQARLAHPPVGEGEDSAGEKKAPPKREEGPFLELAVQKSPENPPAAWLYGSSSAIIGQELRVRVGGGFVWPPPGINVRSLRRVVFVAGGVGVNPLVSMLSSLASSSSSSAAAPALEVRFLYSAKDPGVSEGSAGRNARNILFLERIAQVFHEGRVKGELEVFLTGGDTEEDADTDGEKGDKDRITVAGRDNETKDGNNDQGNFTIAFHQRRCTVDADVAKAVGNPRFAVVYVCGVPTMTDDFVAKLTGGEAEGGLSIEPHRVLCEKWW